MEGKEPDEEMRKRLLHNWVLKLASLALALILWFLVVQFEDPPDTKTFSNIPVKLINTELLDKENKVYEVMDKTDVVSVTVKAPKSIVRLLRASDIVAEADVSKLTDINTIVINCSVQNVEGVDSVESNRDVVRLNVEDKRTKTVKVVSKTTGEVAENYMVGNTQTDLNQIKISGPASAVDQISYAGVEINVTGYTTNLSANLDVSFYDAEDNLLVLDNITKNVDYIHMSVEVLAVKEVPVELNYTGVPAEGYVATGAVVSEPASVRIAGTVYALSGINKISIPEERLNITGADSDVSDTIDLRDYLSDNIRLADGDFNGKVTATVYIEPIVEKELEIPVENVRVVNPPAGMTAELPETGEPYILNVSGLAEFIDPLRQNEIRGVVDIAAWMEEQELTELAPGTYSIPVTFELMEEITAEEITVRVTVDEIV